MKDKVKQIEEIKQIIDDRCEAELGQVHASSMGGKVTKTVDTKLIAKDIYEYLTKDSVVLSREEYTKLQLCELKSCEPPLYVSIERMEQEIVDKYNQKLKEHYAAHHEGLRDQTRKETAEKIMILRGYITKKFHHYHEVRNIAEEKYKKCKEEMGKAVLNNDWHRADAIMFILEDIATEFDKLAKQFGVEIKE